MVNSGVKTIHFDEPMLKRFKTAYDVGLAKNPDIAKNPSGHIFVFEGNEFVYSYAKYLIEYLERSFASEKSQKKKANPDYS